MSLHLNLSTGKFLNSSTLFKLSDALLLDVSSGEIVMSNLLVPRPAGAAPAGLATLDLNFASSLSLDDAVSGNNLITFTRASSGTYVDSSGLIKTSPVNLATYSEQFNNSSWPKVNSTVTPNTTMSPDGVQTADTLTINTGSTFGRFDKRNLGLPSGVYTMSCYLKNTINQGNFSIQFLDPANNSETVVLKNFTGDSTPEWTRFTATVDCSASGLSGLDDIRFNFRPIPSPSDGTNTVDIWGAQLEEGSTATDYIPTTNTISGAPRFDHDPVTGESLGLLIEEERTNLLTYSEEFDDGSYITAANGPLVVPTKTPNQATAPDGSLTADKIDYPAVSAANTYSLIYQNAVTLSGSHSSSIYLRGAVGGEKVYLYYIAGGIYSNTLCTLTTEWQRFSVIFTGGTMSYWHLGVDLRGGSGQVAQSASTIYAWGAQLEEGSFPTSYIPTSGSTVTRAADIATIEGTNFSSWYNQSEGTVFADRTFNINIGHTYYFADSSLTSNRIRLQGITHSGNNSSDGSFFQGSVVGNKTALGLQTDNVAVNGNTFDTSFTMPSSLDRLFIGRHPTVSSYLNGHIARLAYFPTRLPDATLQNITS